MHLGPSFALNKWQVCNVCLVLDPPPAPDQFADCPDPRPCGGPNIPYHGTGKRLSGHCPVPWPSLKQCVQSTILFAFPAKHNFKLYRVGFTLDHLKSFVWAAWRLYAQDTPSKSRAHFTVVAKYAISSGTADGYARDKTPTNAAKHWTHRRMSVTGPAGFLGHSERPALSSTSFYHVSGNSSLISTNSNRTIFS